MAACILYLVILFSNSLESVVPQAKYIDELLLFAFLLAAVVKICVDEVSLDGWNRYDLALAVMLFLVMALFSFINMRFISKISD